MKLHNYLLPPHTYQKLPTSTKPISAMAMISVSLPFFSPSLPFWKRKGVKHKFEVEKERNPVRKR